MVAAFLFVLGIGESGEVPIGGTVFFEFCPPGKRFYMTMLSLFFGVGSTTIAVLALCVALLNNTYIYDWRFIVAFGFICEAVSLIFRYFMIETPAFHISKGNFENAESILNIISLKNTGKEFSYNDKDMLKSGLFELDSSINERNKESLLNKKPLLIKQICKKKFIKLSAILSTVYFI